jgi:hypothetical protein
MIRLRRDHGMVASFSRALLEGLSAQQSDAEFNLCFEKSIQSIFDASDTKQATIVESDGDRMTDPPRRSWSKNCHQERTALWTRVSLS